MDFCNGFIKYVINIKVKKNAIKNGKMVAIISLSLLGILFLIGGYQYLKVAMAPEYDAETMPLNYEVLGSGEKKLLLIHGLAGSKNYWKQHLDKINGTHTLLLVDLLGFGDSPKPRSDYSLTTQLEALEKIIVKEGFNTGQTVIVGHSLGAIITLSLLAEHPDWFAGATTIGLPVFENKDRFTKQISDDSLFDRIAVSPYGKFFCMLHPIYISKWFKPDNLTKDVFADSKKHTWESYYNSFNGIVLQTDLYNKTKNIRDKRILFIQGMEDKVAPIANVKKFASSFTNARLIQVSGGDHQLFLKESSKVWEMIQDFFDEQELNIKT
jgi:pimeloyl-ACP methyl ester carboxylesterase